MQIQLKVICKHEPDDVSSLSFTGFRQILEINQPVVKELEWYLGGHVEWKWFDAKTNQLVSNI